MSTKLARKTDPATSHKAAESVVITAASQKASLLSAFAGNRAGLSDEQAAAYAGMLTVGYWKRAADLRNDGFIEWTNKVLIGSQGRLVGISKITPAGRAALKAASK